MKPRAILFDLDGVLTDTEPIHMGVWQDILAELPIHFTKADYDARYIGLNDRDFLAKILKENKKSLTKEQREKLIGKKEKGVLHRLSNQIPLIPGVEKFLKKIVSQKIPMGLVTGALPSEVHFILIRMQWKKYFPIAITSANVQKGKPDPEGFLIAFQQLQSLQHWDPPLQKSDCLIFEDSKNGLKAAQRAGISCQLVEGSWEAFLKD